MLERLVKDNAKQRFQLVFEPSIATASRISAATSASAASASATPTVGAASDAKGTWWIRANQGHTLPVDDLELTEITDPSQLPVAVHGTTRKTWESICSSSTILCVRSPS